jgi:hypothetical protein
MTDAELKTWAESHPAMPQAAAVLRLLARLDHLQTIASDQLADAMGERDKAREQYGTLRAAIAEHHVQKADDRCIEDDATLYAAAGLPAHDPRVGDKAAMLRNCQRFIERRCEGGGWPSYADLEKRIAELEKTQAERTEGVN